MPVVGIPVDDLERRIGQDLGRERLLEVLGDLGCDVEGFATLRRLRCTRCGYVIELAGKEETPPNCDRCSSDLRSRAGATEEIAPLDVIRMELLAVRPDMFDSAGLARVIRGVLGLEEGWQPIAVHPATMELRIEDTVREETSLRPHIAAAVLDGVHFDDDTIKVLMKLQENLHWALGRNRKHASIGVYDLDSLGGETVLVYTAEDPDTYRFVPLGADIGSEPVPLARILEEHPKGRAFAHLLAGWKRYPILRTAGGRVLSMPPVINSEETRVHLGSRRLVIDVTGTGSRIVNRTLNILVTSLLEYHPTARLEAVELRNATAPDDDGEAPSSESGAARDSEPQDSRPTHRIGRSATLRSSAQAVPNLRSPDLAPQHRHVDVRNLSAILGLDLDGDRIQELLRRMRHNVSATDDPHKLLVEVPPNRNDILHERDLIEDAAIAFGYRNVPRALVPTLTVGRELPATRAGDAIRDVLIGLGHIEVMTLTLTCPERSDQLLGRLPHPDTVTLDNPISTEQTQLRTSLIPELLWTLARNRHHSLPQSIFEVGEVTFQDENADTKAREHLHAAVAIIAPKIGFAEVRALAETIARELGWSFRPEPAEQPFLLSGRAAWIVNPSGQRAGVFGEVHPEVLADRLGLQNPAVLLELAVPLEGSQSLYASFPK